MLPNMAHSNTLRTSEEFSIVQGGNPLEYTPSKPLKLFIIQVTTTQKSVAFHSNY